LRVEASGALKSFPAPLWYPQQERWILEPATSDSAAYNYALPLRVRGRLKAGALQLALQEIVRRHEVFRSSFQVKDGEQWQLVFSARELTVRRIDLSERTAPTADLRWHQFVLDNANQPFDLRSDLLLRATLVRLAPEDHLLLLTTHHSVCDDWSAGILLDELFTLYTAFTEGKASPLPPLSYSYREFAQELAARKASQNGEPRIRFWKEQLRGGPDFYHLSEDRLRTTARVCAAAYLRTWLPREILHEIKALCQRERATPFMVLAGAFQCVLARSSNAEDVGIGVCAANRDGTEIEKLIGPFSNRIVLRTDVSGNPTFREMLNRVRNAALDAYSNQDVPFGEVAKTVAGAAPADRNPLFQVLLILQESKAGSLDVPGLEIRHFPFDAATTRYDLNVWLGTDEARGLQVNLQYNSDLFARATIERILGMYRQTLLTMVANPEARILDPLLQKDTIAPLPASRPLARPASTAPRDGMESRLQIMWAQILGIHANRIDIHQDYFELGGDSLQAAQLFARIEKAFRIRLAVSSLLEARTIEALAGLIRASTPSRKRTALVTVQPCGSRPPIFCVHTHTGSVLFCRDFAKYLDADQPIYGLQSQGVSGGARHFSVEEMATCYIEELKKAQLGGPYRFFGYSFGGLIAFEMANRLQASGERIAFLGMFNTPAPGSLKRWPLGQGSYLQKRIGNELDKLEGFGASAKLSHVVHNGWNFCHMVVRSVKTDAWRMAARLLKPQIANSLAAQMLDVAQINIAAAKNYQPAATFSGRITFFLTKQAPYAYSPGPAAGWSPRAARGIEIVDIPEDRSSPLEERFAKTVCEQMRLSIEADE
jgi:thioesterase domain-containing protein/acyl carrier protein